MAIGQLTFKNRRAGKQPRANFFVRSGRALRRRRVAVARAGAAHALKVAQMEINRFQKLAAAHDVPLTEMGPLPKLADLPGQKWVEHLQDMGPLKEAVKAEPAEPVTA